MIGWSGEGRRAKRKVKEKREKEAAVDTFLLFPLYSAGRKWICAVLPLALLTPFPAGPHTYFGQQKPR